MEDSMNFHDKVVLVAGGTGGLGREVTMAFLEAGAAVDVTDATAVEQFVAGIVAKHRRLDILVNTVGGYAGGINLWEVDSRTYDQMLQLNLKAGFVLARAIVPVLIQQNRGWIVNIASKAAVDHGAGGALYAASKAGALALFDSLA